MTDDKGFLSQIDAQELEKQLNRIPLYLKATSLGKISIGVMVLLLIAAVVVVPFLKPADEGLRIALAQTSPTTKAEKPIMKNPRYESVDGSNQPYTIRAKQAMQIDEESVKLDKLKADVTLNSGMWLNLSANHGELNITSQKLILNEKVHIIASNGYELHAPKAYVNMKQALAAGTTGVSGQGPMGKIRADEFLIEGERLRLLFEKNVKLVIYP